MDTSNTENVWVQITFTTYFPTRRAITEPASHLDDLLMLTDNFILILSNKPRSPKNIYVQNIDRVFHGFEFIRQKDCGVKHWFRHRRQTSENRIFKNHFSPSKIIIPLRRKELLGVKENQENSERTGNPIMNSKHEINIYYRSKDILNGQFVACFK